MHHSSWARPLPIIKPARGYQAAAHAESSPEHRLRGNAFLPRVVGFVADGKVVSPAGNQPPAQTHQFGGVLEGIKSVRGTDCVEVTL